MNCFSILTDGFHGHTVTLYFTGKFEQYVYLIIYYFYLYLVKILEK